MNIYTNVAMGVIFPLLGTTLGAATVFFMKGEMKSALRKTMLGFASGVMIAASVWSLLIPAIEMSEEGGGTGWLPAVVGFLLGIGFLLLLDSLIPHMHLNSDEPEGRSAKLRKSTMLVLAVTLHNIPEGMAVGVVFAGVLSGSTTITFAGAFALALGIAIQNFPEGAVISMPLIGNGVSKGQVVPVRISVGSGGALGSNCDCIAHADYCAGAPVYFGVCCGSHDICGGRGAYSRVPRGKPQ